MIKFLNDKRFWLCAGNCIVAPECFYCQLIYQLNYSKMQILNSLRIVYFTMLLITFKKFIRGIMKRGIGQIIVNRLKEKRLL